MRPSPHPRRLVEAAQDRASTRRTSYIAGVALVVALLYTCFVVVNTQVVGEMTVVPLPYLSDWLYLQDVLDVVAATVLIASGALVLDRLLARDQAVQSATLAGMARVTALAGKIAKTGEFQSRVPDGGADDGPEATPAGIATSHPSPAAVVELADTFNAMLARLEAAFESQRRLLADTSHELRNPLTVLRTNLALVQREDADSQLRLDAAREADEEAARLGRLVDDLLLLGRDSAGDFLQTQPVPLSPLVAQIVGEAREAGTGHLLELDVRAPAVVKGDAERLRQVFRNVVGNALRHTPPDSRVRVLLDQSGAWAAVIVGDDGPGIAPEHLPHVFERFYRVDSARARGGDTGRADGAGLGLSIVKHLVEAHGGTVTIQSTAGAGTTVHVRLPANQ